MASRMCSADLGMPPSRNRCAAASCSRLRVGWEVFKARAKKLYADSSDSAVAKSVMAGRSVTMSSGADFKPVVSAAALVLEAIDSDFFGTIVVVHPHRSVVAPRTIVVMKNRFMFRIFFQRMGSV